MNAELDRLQDVPTLQELLKQPGQEANLNRIRAWMAAQTHIEPIH